LKGLLETKIPGTPIGGVCVTVPVDFNNEQKNALIRACEIAGFDRDYITIIFEPTASIYSYFNDYPQQAIIGRKVMVLDIGGGTFDLALIKTAIVGTATNPDNIETISWGGELFLGGNDVDELLVRNISTNDFKSEINKIYYNADEIFRKGD
jgi:molecular chaperone DnaK (HSP70)